MTVASAPVLDIVVPGTPQQQGSKNPWGGDANENLKPWRGSVEAAAAEFMRGRDLLSGALFVRVRFFYHRPKGHYRTGRHSHELRDDAASHKVSAPDLDKLQRAVGDALEGVVYRNDAQIARWDTEKVYGARDAAHISVWSLEEEHALTNPGGALATDPSNVPGELRDYRGQ